jgi:hypothetical protein
LPGFAGFRYFLYYICLQHPDTEKKRGQSRAVRRSGASRMSRTFSAFLFTAAAETMDGLTVLPSWIAKPLIEMCYL